MSWVKLPSEIENFYLSSLGNAWVEKEVFEEELKDRFPQDLQEFKSLKNKNFMVFFTTELEGQQHDGWEHLMMAVGKVNTSKKFGTFIEISGVFRYGFAVSQVNNLNDAISELEEYFEDGLSHIDQALQENIYYTFLGFMTDFEDLCYTTKLALKEAKF